jgi:hypothetical protein
LNKQQSLDCFKLSQVLHVFSTEAKLCRLFQITPSYAGCFKSSQALQVVSSQAKLCRLFQITPSYAGCLKSSQALQVVSSQAKLRAWLDLKQPAELRLT